mmetsp:Transcript_13699/g.20865  ORF Transcript_13699/g.20865 Transcript_13699/m.20865 type:complete len:213 (+) Transcript_13699:762-1400(+)
MCKTINWFIVARGSLYGVANFKMAHFHQSLAAVFHHHQGSTRETSNAEIKVSEINRGQSRDILRGRRRDRRCRIHGRVSIDGSSGKSRKRWQSHKGCQRQRNGWIAWWKGANRCCCNGWRCNGWRCNVRNIRNGRKSDIGNGCHNGVRNSQIWHLSEQLIFIQIACSQISASTFAVILVALIIYFLFGFFLCFYYCSLLGKAKVYANTQKTE